MIFTVKLDKKNNYFLDKSTGEILDRYDPSNENIQLILKLKDLTLKVDTSSIIQEYGGQIVVQYLDDKYIIDDGYQDILIKCGYIVYKNYDTERIDDISLGISTRNNIIDDIRSALLSLDIQTIIEANSNDTLVKIENNSYSYKIRFDTISNIVTKNYKRKDNSLTYYPFEKSMDKFGTIYVSIFAQKKSNINSQSKFDIPNNIIQDLVKELGLEYHYVSLPIKGRVLYWQGL